MKVIESNNYTDDIYCPFCKQKIVDMNEYHTNVCSHTLFIAHDEGFEFIHDQVREDLGIPKEIDILEIEPEDYIDDDGFDALTSSVSIKDAVKFAVYVPPPGCMGAYYGFSENI